MISAFSATVREAQQSEADPQFTVGVPRLNPLAASSPFALTKHANGVLLDSLAEFREEDVGAGDGIGERMITGARRQVAIRPNSARARTVLGVALLNCGQLAAAEAEFKVALDIEPTQYVAATNLARIKVQVGKFDEAELIYATLQSHHPENVTPRLSLAFIAMKRQDYGGAERLLREAIRLGHRAVTAKYHLAMVLLKQGKSDEPIALLRAVARDQVRAPSVYEGLGTAYALKGDLHRAAIAFKTALSLAPGSPNATLGLARMLLGLKQSDETVVLLAEHLERSPHDFAAKELLATAYRDKKQYRSAIAHLTHIFAAIEGSEDQSVQRARIANNIGALFLSESDDRQGRRWLLKSIECAPFDGPIPYENLTRTYLRMRELDRAAETAKLIRARFPDDPTGVELLIACLRELEFYDDAIREAKGFIASGKTATAAIYSDLGHLVADAKRDYDSAVDILREGYEKFKGNALLANNLAYAYLMSGEAGAARLILESIKMPDDGLEKEHLGISVTMTATWGLLHLVEGDLETGRQLYKKAEKLAAQQPDKRLARVVLQKMHLELARMYLRQRDYESARAHLRKGLTVRKASELYAQDLRTLERSIQLPQGEDPAPM